MCIKVKKCCFCVDLRTGAVVIAVLGIVGSLANLAFSRHWMIITEVIYGLLLSFCLLFGVIKENKFAVLIYLILNVLQIILIFAVGIFLLVPGSALKVISRDDGSTADTWNEGISEMGIIKTQSELTKEIGQRIVTKDENDLDFFGAVGIAAIIGGVIFILRAFLQIYFFICIHSFYKKIIKGKTTSSATVTVERVTERVTVT